MSKDNVTLTAKALDDKTVLVLDPTEDFLEDILRRDRPREKLYSFDSVFSDSCTQIQVFEKTVRFLIGYVLQGFNATVFAYGATGAGKTYTMLGTESKPGIMALTLADLFNKIQNGQYHTSDETCEVSLTYLEIYNENIRDLLSGKPDLLELREDSSKGVVVAGITSVVVHSAEEVMMFLRKGNKHRSQEPTGANEVSSRSHAVLQVLVTFKKNNAQGQCIERHGKLSMIDLAGSERAAETNNRGMRMIEGANINRSLLALGNCINALVDTGKRGKYVNYRDSKLTRLLKDSLGGNCRTVMIANISPSSTNFDETMNTLKYASRARTIKTKVSQQIDYKFDIINPAIQQMQSDNHELMKNRFQSFETRESQGARPPRLRSQTASTAPVTLSPAKSNHSKLDVDVYFNDACQMLETIFNEQSTLRTKLLEADEIEADSATEVIKIQKEIDGLLYKLENAMDNRGIIEKEINQKKEEIQSLHVTQKQTLQLKESFEAQMNDMDHRIKVLQQSAHKSMDEKARKCIELLIKSHYTEMDNMDLDLQCNLASGSMKQKEEEMTILYRLLELYDDIVQFQLRERTTAIPLTLNLLLTSLKELKAQLDLSRANDEFKYRSRRRHQFQSLVDRHSVRTSGYTTPVPIPMEPMKTIEEDHAPNVIEESTNFVVLVPEKQQQKKSLGIGIAKLLGKTSSKLDKAMDAPKKEQAMDEPMHVEERYNIADLLENTKGHTNDQALRAPSLERFSPKLERTSTSPTLRNQSNLSKSLQMLERQVEELTSKPKHQEPKADYIEQFRMRNQERLSKLNLSSPESTESIGIKSESTLGATMYEKESKSSSGYSILEGATNPHLNRFLDGLSKDSGSLSDRLLDSQPKQSKFDSRPKTDDTLKSQSNEPMKSKLLDLFASPKSKQAVMQSVGDSSHLVKKKMEHEFKPKMHAILHSKRDIKRKN